MALEVGVYAVAGTDPPELIGTFTGCVGCDPDLFRDGDARPDG